jgi:hypothetical protein
LIVCLSLGLPVAGCSGFVHRFTVNSTAPVLKAGSAAMESESDVRIAREALPTNLKTIEAFLVTVPDQPDLLEVLAQGYTQFAFAFLEDDLEKLPADESSPERQALIERCTNLYDRAYGFAVHLASLTDERIVGALKQGDAGVLDGVLKKKFDDADEGPGIYWAGLAMGSAINLHKDDMDRIAGLPKVIALLERAHAIAPEYFHHGPAMALGVVYAAQGKAVGGNPERSKQMFEEVIKATNGKFLMAKVLLARFYATVTQDRPLFEKTLNEVLATPSDVWPEQRLANELAKRRAARYLAQVEDLF